MWCYYPQSKYDSEILFLSLLSTELLSGDKEGGGHKLTHVHLSMSLLVNIKTITAME